MMSAQRAAARFYKAYIAYYLSNPEKPHLKNQFISSMAFFLLFLCFQFFMPPSTASRVLDSAVITIFSSFLVFYFGYLGLMVVMVVLGAGGMLMLHDWTASQDPTAPVVLVHAVGTMVSSTMIAHLSEKERKRKEKLEILSFIDGLTEVFNHRYLQQRLAQEMERARVSRRPLGLMILDIDNFKRYNDAYGHKMGDEVLKQTALFLKGRTRAHDVICRFGGDEFALLMPDVDTSTLEGMERKIRQSFSKWILYKLDGVYSPGLTLSVGMSIYEGGKGNPQEFLAHAEEALYHAKHSGKNIGQFYRDIFEEIKQKVDANEHELIGSFKALLGAVSAKDKYTFGHSERVSFYAVMISNALGLSHEEVFLMQIAGLLHDIGKIEIPQEVLNKQGPLSREEFQLIYKHPVYSSNILEPLKGMEKLAEIVRHHHERYDGLGYPDQLKSTKIPLGSRILAVADAYDAMCSNRPYRRTLTLEMAKEELRKNAGMQFDPYIVQVFIEQMEFSSVS